MDDDVSQEIKIRRRKRAIKVAITEGLMVVAVIALVLATTLIAIGYNLNPGKDWTIERTGLVQIQTLPTGANVTLDGNMLFGWTNLSRSMSEGEHEIVISKDKYDSWTKNITVTAGLYYRLNYPRLFLLERETKEVADFSKMQVVSFAKDGNLMLAIPAGSTTWELYRINEEKPTKTELKVDGLFSGAEAGQFSGEVEILGWSGNNERVLLFVNGEYVLLDVKKYEASVNLTQKFGSVFLGMKIANDAASEIFALDGASLRKIDVETGEISGVLVSGVESFDNLKGDVVFVTEKDEDGIVKVGVYRKGDKGATILAETEDKNKVLAVMGEYYGQYYVLVAADEEIEVFSGKKLPSFGEDEEMELVLDEKIEFTPKKLEVSGGGELMLAVNGTERAVFDVEVMDVVKITTLFETEWLDEYMLYGVSEGKLGVMDFDGENYRVLAEDAKTGTEVKISKNNKWLYYLDVDNKLMRVQIN